MNNSSKYNVEEKKPDTKEYVLCDSIYIMCENRQNFSVLLEARMVAIFVGSGEGKLMTRMGLKRVFGRGELIMLFCNLGTRYTEVLAL